MREIYTTDNEKDLTNDVDRVINKFQIQPKNTTDGFMVICAFEKKSDVFLVYLRSSAYRRMEVMNEEGAFWYEYTNTMPATVKESFLYEIPFGQEEEFINRSRETIKMNMPQNPQTTDNVLFLNETLDKLVEKLSI